MAYRTVFPPSTSRDVIRNRAVPLKSRTSAAAHPYHTRGVTVEYRVDRPRNVSCTGFEAAHAYVSEVAQKYKARMRQKAECSKQLEIGSESSTLLLMKQRLSRLIGECDIGRTTCCVPMCGRVFDSIPVLAFHMSYSHHDLAAKSAYDTLCFVCGVQMNNVKGKIIHLVSKHKTLCAAHNEQCLHQRTAVISPLAPAAMRIAQCSGEEEEVDEPITYENVPFEDLSGTTYIETDLDYEDAQYDS
ncbi:unnamed protein product [Cylicocyclus nassatus]|uniref:C2H2-type domain-containing protein n=1 Tax=Cylicocyclus nassatus TaxID=53992 RepID=A0AA36GVQ6_CYLNA|nr:unnamed protein product [Cylicocyclus nassatus]